MIWQKIGFDLVILRLNAAHEPNSFTFTSRNTKPINQIYGLRFKEIPGQARHDSWIKLKPRESIIST